MALELSTAGVEVRYCVESTKGSRPTSGYTKLSNIKSTPDYNAEPSALDVTDFADLVWKRSIPGLKDAGSSVAFGANLTKTFMSGWASCVSAAETGKASELSTWFEIYIPNLGDSFFFAGMPVELGLSAMEVDAVVEASAYIVPNKILGWASSTSI